jgi:competence protein ComGC
MAQSLETLIVTLIVIIVIFVVLLFLPAIIELKKPKDAGPRVLIDFAQICLLFKTP